MESFEHGLVPSPSNQISTEYCASYPRSNSAVFSQTPFTSFLNPTIQILRTPLFEMSDTCPSVSISLLLGLDPQRVMLGLLQGPSLAALLPPLPSPFCVLPNSGLFIAWDVLACGLLTSSTFLVILPQALLCKTDQPPGSRYLLLFSSCLYSIPCISAL